MTNRISHNLLPLIAIAAIPVLFNMFTNTAQAQEADIRIRITSSPAAVQQGNTVTLNVTVENPYANPVYSMKSMFWGPTGSTIISSTRPGGVIGIWNDGTIWGRPTLTWGERTYAPGHSESFSVTAQLLPTSVHGCGTTYGSTYQDWTPIDPVVSVAFKTQPCPTPSPTPTPTPTPAPKKAKGLNVFKSDGGRDITRPDHTFSYTITAQNTGDADLDNVIVKDNVPDQFSVTSVTAGGNISGQTVTWSGFHLNSGEKRNFTINVKVRTNAPNGEVCNIVTATADSLSDTGKDCINVDRKPIVKAVKVTTPTGPGSAALISTVLGSLGIILARRFWSV